MQTDFIKANDLILFQGDSITDTDRRREASDINNRAGLGSGYALMAASQLAADRVTDNLRFLNRGISGNRVVDLFARWTVDALNLKPNVISILIGVNDTWHRYNYQNGVPVPKYERVYREILTETRATLPEVKLVLCEPFDLRCGVVTEEWVIEVNQRREAVAKLAAEFGARHVPFQSMFDAACQKAPPEYWASDGVHPTGAGHLIMAREWLRAVGHLNT
jgi:lysophospholipase L1-like esterase